MKVRTARGRGGRRLCGRGAMTLLLESDPLPLLPSVASAAAFAHQSCGRGRAFKRKKGARESFPVRSFGGEDVCCSKQGSKKARVKANVSGGGGRRETGKEGLSAPLSLRYFFCALLCMPFPPSVSFRLLLHFSSPSFLSPSPLSAPWLPPILCCERGERRGVEGEGNALSLPEEEERRI